ncbi:MULTISPECIES: hypothetical protein [unclassified Leifsonia]|uniref:hypothetical protein n=1 Tax=unclassified Leifsonia TaxID=2663824 RepID=UPI000B7EE4AA|nr:MULTISPECIES: hypothetical protein [unclassified Leifsonia]
MITMVRGRGVKSTPTLAGVEGNSGLLEFTIDREIGRDDSAVVLIPPLNSKPLYPNENIGALEPVVLTVTSPAGDHSASLPLVGEPVATPSAPWGLELAGVWGDAKVTELRKERLYRYPTFVQLMSVGPSAVPAGGVLTLDVDAGVVSSLAVNTISRDGVLLGRNAFSAKEDTGRGSLRLDITLADQVLPEEVITVLLTTALVEGQPDLEGVTIARAKFAASETDARPQRDTGRSTFIDVTNSGSSSSAAVAMGTV